MKEIRQSPSDLGREMTLIELQVAGTEHDNGLWWRCHGVELPRCGQPCGSLRACHPCRFGTGIFGTVSAMTVTAAVFTPLVTFTSIHVSRNVPNDVHRIASNTNNQVGTFLDERQFKHIREQKYAFNKLNEDMEAVAIGPGAEKAAATADDPEKKSWHNLSGVCLSFSASCNEPRRHRRHLRLPRRRLPVQRPLRPRRLRLELLRRLCRGLVVRGHRDHGHLR